jgi:hypothetical protein
MENHPKNRVSPAATPSLTGTIDETKKQPGANLILHRIPLLGANISS